VTFLFDELAIMGTEQAVAPFLVVEVEVKFTLEHATKAQRGSTGIALLFL